MKVLNLEKPIIAMIHVDALPGTPKYGGNIKTIIKKAKSEALLYKDAGIDVLMIENMHDVPYLNRNAGPEITSIMSILLYEVKNISNLPSGIQVLAGGNKQALGAALAAGGDFIRAEGFVYAHVADEGFFNSDAGEILRYRKQIGAEHISIFTDIKKKHSSHSITDDTDITDTAKAAEFFLSDGVIITGTATGKKPSLEEIRNVKEAVNIPIIAGSGITKDNVLNYLQYCDALIIGSYFKTDGKWNNPVDINRVKKFVDVLK
ncbi:MAG: BtpA/SgcQ family protein [Ignavibacteriaceae bacterium]|nr:BtpA/SgcQ family protein [Ignavibacteriaceae bacterium]